jgi:hypothetical protein
VCAKAQSAVGKGYIMKAQLPELIKFSLYLLSGPVAEDLGPAGTA